MYNHSLSQKGFSLVEVIFVAALSVLVFGVLLSSFQYSLKLINQSRSKLSALSVANDRMEFFRSLPYNDIGTISGIISGAIPQNSIVTLNDIEFHERVLVEYVDDPADGKAGTATPDSNGIPSDYKCIKLEYTWDVNGTTNVVSLISNIVPRSIESTAGGGTVKINVIDENSALLPGASVRLINNTTGSPIDVTRIADAGGVALFSGAPAASNYEVIVTANISGHQYSTAQTYETTGANPNPIVSPFSVLVSDISTLTFQIGELSDLDIKTLSAVSEGVLKEEFTNLLAVDSSVDVEAVGGRLKLANVSSVYKTSGIAYLGVITPAPLLRWQTVRVAVDLPASTSHKVQLFTGVPTGPYTLIPDSELSGNVVGFTDTLIDISSLDPIAYPSIYIGVTLETTDTNVTPSVDEISLYYRNSETDLAGASFGIRGSKIIGTDAVSAPIYKYTDSLTTDGSGDVTIAALEFDTHVITPNGGYDIAMACPAHPFIHQAGVDGELEMVLVPNAVTTLRVSVIDTLGRVIPGAFVNLNRTGYTDTILTDSCGQVFFTGGLINSSDYEINVTATGYNNQTVSAFDINGDTLKIITLTQ
jgi:type II secretory pathway pseudopilin PulG